MPQNGLLVRPTYQWNFIKWAISEHMHIRLKTLESLGTKIVNGISNSNLSYVRVIKEDPVRKGMLYLGTENALYVSYNDGRSWQSLMTNLPPAPMYWIDIQEHFNDLVIGTYGRGIWIMDDLSSLQQMTDEITKSDAYLFQPKNMLRLRPMTGNMQFFPEPHFGKDPKEGGAIDYWLSEANDKVKLHIVNSAGDTIRTLKHKGKPGINRVMWNFKGDPSDEIELHTKPQYAKHFMLDKNRKRKSTVGKISVLHPPGSYTVRTTINGKSFERSFVLEKDPHSEGSQEDILAQVSMVKDLKQDMNQVAKMINQIEDVRRQLIDMKAMMSKDKKGALKDDFKAIGEKLITFEGKLLQLKVTEQGQDMVRWPVKLAERIFYLASTVITADFAPADPHLEVHEILKNRLSEYQTEFDQLMNEDLKGFVDKLKEHGFGPLIY